MRIRVLQHAAFEGPGCIADWVRRGGHALATTHLHRGERLPPASAWDGLVVLGGPMGVHEEDRHAWLAAEKRYLEHALAQQRPVLGICLGAQLLAHVLGAKVFRNAWPEVGWFPVERTAEAAEARHGAALPARFEALHWHGDAFDTPPGALHLARSAACACQAFARGERVLGLQFHLETSRAGAEALVRHDPGALSPGPFVQPASEILAQPERFERAHQHMDALLDTFFVAERPEAGAGLG